MSHIPHTYSCIFLHTYVCDMTYVCRNMAHICHVTHMSCHTYPTGICVGMSHTHTHTHTRTRTHTHIHTFQGVLLTPLPNVARNMSGDATHTPHIFLYIPAHIHVTHTPHIFLYIPAHICVWHDRICVAMCDMTYRDTSSWQRLLLTIIHRNMCGDVWHDIFLHTHVCALTCVCVCRGVCGLCAWGKVGVGVK